ncbi:MAG: hypothetical protein PSN34_03035 [Urechidicola sp.]|nr:hypothetical protein [Urechidicola sp.]
MESLQGGELDSYACSIALAGMVVAAGISVASGGLLAFLAFGVAWANAAETCA